MYVYYYICLSGRIQKHSRPERFFLIYCITKIMSLRRNHFILTLLPWFSFLPVTL